MTIELSQGPQSTSIAKAVAAEAIGRVVYDGASGAHRWPIARRVTHRHERQQTAWHGTETTS